jgi:hypothetical protein
MQQQVSKPSPENCGNFDKGVNAPSASSILFVFEIWMFQACTVNFAKNHLGYPKAPPEMNIRIHGQLCKILHSQCIKSKFKISLNDRAAWFGPPRFRMLESLLFCLIIFKSEQHIIYCHLQFLPARCLLKTLEHIFDERVCYVDSLGVAATTFEHFKHRAFNEYLLPSESAPRACSERVLAPDGRADESSGGGGGSSSSGGGGMEFN